MKTDIVMFWFMNDWGKYGRAYEKIAENLAVIPEIGRIICFFPALERKSLTWPMEPGKVEQINEKLSIVNIYYGVLKYNRFLHRRMVNLINGQIYNIYLKKIVEKFQFKKENTILWMFPPHKFIYRMMNKIPFNFLITQIIDNNVFMDDMDPKYKKFIERQYRILAEKSDAVITSSKVNYEIFSRFNKNCGLFENAVENKFISVPSESPYRVSQCRPRLGYVGVISQRTDLVLMKYIAKNRTEYDLVIAGPLNPEQKENMDDLLKFANVSYIGEIPYSDVPQFIQSLDVCLIPHLDTAYSRSMSPLKLYQYLGSGKPIISTIIAGVKKYENVVSLGKNYDEFLKKIDEGLQEKDLSKKQKRIEIAKNETWERRVKEIWEFIRRIRLEKNRFQMIDCDG